MTTCHRPSPSPVRRGGPGRSGPEDAAGHLTSVREAGAAGRAGVTRARAPGLLLARPRSPGAPEERRGPGGCCQALPARGFGAGHAWRCPSSMRPSPVRLRRRGSGGKAPGPRADFDRRGARGPQGRVGPKRSRRGRRLARPGLPLLLCGSAAVTPGDRLSHGPPALPSVSQAAASSAASSGTSIPSAFACVRYAFTIAAFSRFTSSPFPRMWSK